MGGVFGSKPISYQQMFSSIQEQPYSILVRDFERKQRMMRIELLQFLPAEDVLRLALTCKKMMVVVDPNAIEFKKGKGGRQVKVEYHLPEIARRQLGDLLEADKTFEKLCNGFLTLKDFMFLAKGVMLHMADEG